ncbi:MAG: hypothetical protein AAF235_06915 [Planctomycetota bacterium]
MIEFATRLFDLAANGIEAVRLWLSLRGRLRGRYWQWRMNTATGGQPLTPQASRRAGLHFLAWRRRMRGMMR